METDQQTPERAVEPLSEGNAAMDVAERPAWRPLRWLIAIGTIAVLVLAALALVRGDGLPARVTPLKKIAPVPAFTLIERSGRTATNEDLVGHVWLADFFFTSCAGPCPELSLRFRGLQKEIAAYDGAVKLVSFSIDPILDQPPVLQSYAKRYGAESNLWWFLTGNDQEAMHELVRTGFLQSVVPAKGGRQIVHSTYFVLVDQAGWIRGFYEGLDPASKPKILRDIAWLVEQGAER